MQNSELKNEILGQHKEVSAAELKRYASEKLSPSEARAIEDKIHSNDFSSDAVDGLKTYGSAASMALINKKYSTASPYKQLPYALSAVLVIIVGVWAFSYINTTSDNQGNQPIVETEISPLTPEVNSDIEPREVLIKTNQEKEVLTEKTSTTSKTPESTEASDKGGEEHTPLLFSTEIENEIFKLSPIESKAGKLFKNSEKAKLKTKSARLRHYKNYKLVDQGIGIDQSLLLPILEGTPAFKETIVINPKYPDWVPADSIYKCSMNEGIDWLIDKDYNQARMRFKRLLENTPEDLTAAFYLGYTYYLDEKYEQALVYLHMAQIHLIQTYDHDARFLEIKCYLNLGRDEDAKKEAEYLKNADSFYADRALELVD